MYQQAATLVSGNSLRLERMSFFVSIVFQMRFFYTFCVLRTRTQSFLLFFLTRYSFSGARNMEMFLVLVDLHKVRDCMPQVAGTVPLRTGNEVHAF